MSNREIKFRVRETKPSKRWAYFSIPHKIIWEGVWDLETLGQFTGLKDKNGKDIYEGDVIAWGPLVGKIESGRYVTENEDNEDILGWMIISEQRAYALDPQTPPEIIGNIYENPELLGDTNTPQGN